MTRRVLIAIPTLTGEIGSECHLAMLAAQKDCMAHGIEVEHAVVKNCTPPQVARNMLWETAVRGEYDDMVMVDADQDFHGDWVRRLLAYPVDCVGGVYRRKTDAENYAVLLPKGGFVRDPATGLWRTAGLGAGFLRVSRRALLALWKDAEPYTIGGKPGGRWIMDMHPINGELVGEDVMISAKLWEHHEIPTWLDPYMVCGHWGTKRYHGNFVAWCSQQCGQSVLVGATP